VARVHPFHDELPGTSVAGVYLDNEADYRRVERLLNDTLDASLAEITARLDRRGQGGDEKSVPLVLYNPLAWARGEPVRVTLRLSVEPGRLRVRNTDGHLVPVQVYDVRQQAPYWCADVGFLARDVPSTLDERVQLFFLPLSGELCVSSVHLCAK